VGKARVELIVDGVRELIDVLVTVDDRVMQLRKLIAEIAPTAGVTASGTKISRIIDGKLTEEEAVILTGTVTNALDAVAIVEAAKRLFPASELGQSAAPVGSGVVQTAILQGNVINRIMVAGVHQVQLEVVVAIVNRSELRNMSFSFSANGSKFFAGSIFGADQFANALATGMAAANGTQNATVNLPFAIQNGTGSFMGFLQALRTEGLTKILSEPRLTTLSGRPASIVSGGQVPVLVGSGNGSSTVEYKDFGTKVNFLPIVLGNGRIHLEVAAEISDVDPTLTLQIGGIQPTSISGFRKRSAQVTVQIEDGQTLAIGGLIQNTVRGTIARVPFLGDLPYLGAAFSTKSYNEIEEEMVIIVTPRLVDGVDCCKIPKFLPGRETRSPDDFELFLEGILEAPRGQRNVGIHPYRPAFQGSANAGQYPCGDGNCGARGGCANGNCASSQSIPQLSTIGTSMPSMAMPTPTFPDAKGFTEVKGTPTSNSRVNMEPELPNSFPPIREIPGSLGPVTPTAPLPSARQQDVRPVLPPLSPR
jgi:pilus assembly protein CpaC